MLSFFKKIAFFLLIFSFFIVPQKTLAITIEECEKRVGKGELNTQELGECERIFSDFLSRAGQQKQTLKNEIDKFNAAISLTTTRIYTTSKQIEALEKEISDLGQKINRLDISLDQISQVLIRRIAETYKKGRIEPLTLLFSSDDFSDFVSRWKYLRVMQAHDKKLMIQLENVRTNYEDQKNLKEEKQAELEAAKKKLKSQKAILAQQKADKENLLRITQNNEIRYQNLLAATRAEIEAIQRIIAGKGKCSEVKKVTQGEKIASIIYGPSACSIGTHLHFEIRERGEVRNPFSYLKNIDLIDNSGINNFGSDPHIGTGSWEWPLNQPIKFNQGYGSNTAAIRSGIVGYNFHTGIDISSEDRIVKAVKSGTLYRCSISCGGGVLRYVLVKHDEGEIDTYYLHVNY